MVTSRHIILILIFLFANCISNAQHLNLSTENRKAIKLYKGAEQSFILGNADIAKKQLKDAIKKDDQFAEAWLLLGDINTDVDNYDEAISNYKKALDISGDSFYFAYYLIGNLEFIMGNYKSSLDYYNAFIMTNKLSEEEVKNTEIRISKTKIALQIQNNPLDISLKNMGDIINSKSDEYINFVDEKLEFLYITRKEKNPEYYLDRNPFKEHFYFTTLSDRGWDTLRLFELPVKPGLNAGAVNFSIDRRQLFFAGCSWPENYGSCDVYQSFKYGQEWGSVNNLGAGINSTSWDSQPILSSDGKTLYFASKRKGGYGGSDIWKSEKQNNGIWGKPINLGDHINTPNNEMAPYIHADTKTFYFSSDGHDGLGGYDLFMSRIHDDGTWQEVKNLGAPVNSNYNEINIFISIDANVAWISTDRKGGFGGFDIYEFVTQQSIKPEQIVYIRGIVTDTTNNQPLNARIKLTNLDQNVSIIVLQSDPIDGSFFVPIYPGTNYGFNISSPGYLFYSENLNFSDSLKFSSIEKTFKLTPIEKGSSMVLNNVYFDFDSDSIKASSYPELDLLVELLRSNPELKISINGHTDSTGDKSYNLILSTKRAQAVRKYLIGNNIEQDRLLYQGFGDSRPIKSNETEEGRTINRRTEMVVL